MDLWGWDPALGVDLERFPRVAGMGEAVGTVGVLGPTRMDYAQALAAVAVVGKRLGRRLSEG